MEKLNYLLTSSYIWLFILFSFSLPYLLKYMRQLYPEHVRKKMELEEACQLEYNQHPKIKRIRKYLTFSILFFIILSYIISYYLLSPSERTFQKFANLFICFSMPIVIYFGVVEYSVYKEGKNCKEVIVGYKFMKWLGILEVLIIVSLMIFLGIKEMLK